MCLNGKEVLGTMRDTNMCLCVCMCVGEGGGVGGSRKWSYTMISLLFDSM